MPNFVWCVLYFFEIVGLWILSYQFNRFIAVDIKKINAL